MIFKEYSFSITSIASCYIMNKRAVVIIKQKAI